MRKKIFLIHGKGKKNGLGSESGGDLDTVSSNAFYSTWINGTNGSPAQYGVDYEYDFVNYQEGLRHLDVHSGSDLYLPDFPIDALAPSLQMHRLRRPEAAPARCGLFNHVDELRRVFYRNPNTFPGRWKDRFNDLNDMSNKLLSDRKFYEVNNGRFYAGLFKTVAKQIRNDGEVGPVASRLEEYLFGQHYLQLKEILEEQLDSYLKHNLVDDIPQHKVQQRLLAFDSSKSDYGHQAKLSRSSQLLSLLVESVSVLTKTYFLVAKLGNDIPDDNRDQLLDWTESIRLPISRTLNDLNDLLNQVKESNPDHPLAPRMQGFGRNLNHFWEHFRYETVLDDYESNSDTFGVHLTEEATGAPVSDIEVVFNVTGGDVTISPVDYPERKASSLSIPTDSQGVAEINIHGDFEPNQGVTATYDEMNFLSFPRTLDIGTEYFDEHPDPESIEFKLIEQIEGTTEQTSDTSLNLDSIEKGGNNRPERSLKVQKTLIRRHVDYLNEHDVRLIRLDDHHPYTPEILDTLEDLKENGLIESIKLSSLPRGQHQPKEEQLCGADLIYGQFVKGQPFENSGLEKLREVTHHQDLHIDPRPLGNQLSKLIGSKYSKIEMAEGLRSISGEQDFNNILENRGWDAVIQDYEQRLSSVLPRLGQALYRITFVIPPPDNNYVDKVGWKKYTNPIAYFLGTDRERSHLLKSLYANETGRKVTLMSTLSPFCDSNKGEPNINVASALNYLKQYFTFDYFFYSYGSFLLSTRRVNEAGYDIDLSKLVSKIGSPADGGHPGAATGSPESNPNFPQERFDSVSEENFAEFLYYVMDTVEEHTDLELLAIDEVYPEEFEGNLRDHLSTLREQTVLLTLMGSNAALRVSVTDGLYTPEDQPDVSLPLAISHLRQVQPMDYFFYSKSSSNLILRNVDDPRESMDLSNIAETLGTDRNGGHPRAASCEPRFNRHFPESRFKQINDKNFEDYVKYLADRIVANHNFDEYQVKPLF